MGLQIMASREEISSNPYTGHEQESWFWIDNLGGDMYYNSSSSSDEFSLIFTPETVATVTQISAIPEPQTYIIFGAGMLLLGAAARRRNTRR